MNRPKAIIKFLLLSILGENRAKRLFSYVHRRQVAFSEADLIYEYFLQRSTPGFMVDVGAHHGESLLPYQRRGWRILAFEPDPKNRKTLIDNVDQTKVEILTSAVSDKIQARVPFYASAESSGISSLTAFRENHQIVGHVDKTTLAVELTARPVTSVEFLKIDTEGHDLLVLNGFPWNHYMPEVILCEFEDMKTRSLGYNYEDLGNLLISHSYHTFLSEWAPIVRYGQMHQWRSLRRYPCRLTDPNGWGNFIAFRGTPPIGMIETYLRQFNAWLS